MSKTIPQIGNLKQLPTSTALLEVGDEVNPSSTTNLADFGQKVATIADLAALPCTGVANGILVYVMGFSVAGDGGGGPFRYNSSGAATPVAGMIVNATGGGQWERVYGRVVNVLWLGAKPSNNSADASANNAAFQAAADYCLSFQVDDSGGLELFIPAGAFFLSAEIVFTRPVGWKISGAGKWATIIKWSGSSGSAVWKLYNARDTNVSDVSIWGNATGGNKPESLIEVQGDTTDPDLIWAPSNCSFTNCRFGSSVLDCANYDVKYTWAGLGNNNDQGVFYTCEFANATEANIYWSVANAKNYRFYGCTMVNSKRGIYNYHGSFNWFGGVMSGHSVGNFVFNTMGDSCLIMGIDSETSDRFIYFDGGATGNGTNLVVQCGRFSTDNLNSDGNAIYFRANGGFHMSGVQLAEYSSANKALIYLESGGNPGAATIESCTFGATGSSTVSPISGLGTGYTVTLRNNSYVDGSNNWVAGDRDMISATNGDADATFYARLSRKVQLFSTTLTANRTVTLSTTGAVNGDKFRVVRTGLGAFTLDVGGLKTIASSTAAFVDVEFNGSAWLLTGYGAL